MRGVSESRCSRTAVPSPQPGTGSGPYPGGNRATGQGVSCSQWAVSAVSPQLPPPVRSEAASDSQEQLTAGPLAPSPPDGASGCRKSSPMLPLSLHDAELYNYFTVYHNVTVITIVIQCTVNVMCLNHPETIYPSICGKTALELKRFRTAALEYKGVISPDTEHHLNGTTSPIHHQDSASIFSVTSTKVPGSSRGLSQSHVLMVWPGLWKTTISLV